MDKILTIPEVAEYLQMSKSKVYDLAKRGIIPTIQIGRNVRVTESDLEKWLEEQRRPTRLF
jgi:excisionase family DNA binding protein